MLELNSWLLVASLSTLSIQGTQLLHFKLQLTIAVAYVLPVVIAIVLSDFVVTQSLPAWNKLVTAQLQSLQIVILLEAALVCFSPFKLLPIGALLAFCFGHLNFLQQGFVDWSFTMQGLIYGVAVSVIIMLNHYLAKIEEHWTVVLFVVLLMSTFLTSNQKPESVNVAYSLTEMLISLLSIAALLAIGMLRQKIRIFRKNK